jgi:hypothetical protein
LITHTPRPELCTCTGCPALRVWTALAAGSKQSPPPKTGCRRYREIQEMVGRWGQDGGWGSGEVGHGSEKRGVGAHWGPQMSTPPPMLWHLGRPLALWVHSAAVWPHSKNPLSSVTCKTGIRSPPARENEMSCGHLPRFAWDRREVGMVLRMWDFL